MLKIFNSLTRKKEEFKPLNENKVSMYVCGPTVYDIPHIGHGRSAMSFDVIRRYLEYLGYNVTFATNYTDIDDKMIERANAEGISVEDLAARVIPQYEASYAKLGVKTPTLQPKATDNIEGIIELIKILDEKGYVYTISDGVYYDVNKFEEYGKLSGQKLEDLRMGSRVAVNDEKKNPYDFAVWKFKKDGEPFWASPWGDGRPGWHIECSAMTYEVFGEKFDIHSGGGDLAFPHHECEIAQSEGCFGPGSFAQYWMHNGMINIDNEKMSKSLNNFFTLEDVLAKYDAKVIRLMYLKTHYAKPINFSDALLDQSAAMLERLHALVRRLRAFNSEHDVDNSSSFGDILHMVRRGFEDSMNEDFDTSGALGNIFDFLKSVNGFLDKDAIGANEVAATLKFLSDIDSVFGVILPDEDDEVLDDKIKNMIDKRQVARQNKDYAASDVIRDELLEMGILLEDGPDGVIWRRK